MLDNKDLIRELKIEGISDKNILRAIEKVPREFFVAQGLIDRA